MKIKTLSLVVIILLGASCPSILKEKKDRVKSWQDYFPDPVERIYVVMKDKIAFKYTNYEERLIYLGGGSLEGALKKETYEIKDIAIIIHNHRFERKFSDADWRFYRDLKKRKFDGQFLIYCHLTKEVYSIEEHDQDW